jgi:hypothetical protein
MPHPGRFVPQERDKIPAVQEAGWAWWRSGRMWNISPPTGIRSQDLPARSDIRNSMNQNSWKYMYTRNNFRLASKWSKAFTKSWKNTRNLPRKNKSNCNMGTEEYSTLTNCMFLFLFLLLICLDNVLFWYTSVSARNARRFDMVVDSNRLWWCYNKHRKHINCNNWFPVQNLYTEKKTKHSTTICFVTHEQFYVHGS